MSLMSGGVTLTRFRVGEVAIAWRDTFRMALTKSAFRDPPGQGKEEIEGWARVQNLLMTDFEDFNTWVFGPFVVFTLRVDKKTLPSRLLAATVDIEGRKWAAERGVERVPSAIRKEIKERIEEQWLDRALPRVATTEICWNVTEGWAVVASHAGATIDRIRKRFFTTFGVRLIPWSPLDAVDEDTRTSLVGGASIPIDSANETPTPPNLAGEFYLWLWWASEQQEGRFDLPAPVGMVQLWIESRLTFRRTDEMRPTATMTGSNPAAAVESRAAIRGGKTLHEVQIGLRRDDREYTLSLKGIMLAYAGLRLPGVLSDAAEEAIIDRMLLVEDVHLMIDALFAQFAEIRQDLARWAEVRRSIGTWAGEDIEDDG